MDPENVRVKEQSNIITDNLEQRRYEWVENKKCSENDFLNIFYFYSNVLKSRDLA